MLLFIVFFSLSLAIAQRTNLRCFLHGNSYTWVTIFCFFHFFPSIYVQHVGCITDWYRIVWVWPKLKSICINQSISLFSPPLDQEAIEMKMKVWVRVCAQAIIPTDLHTSIDARWDDTDLNTQFQEYRVWRGCLA